MALWCILLDVLVLGLVPLNLFLLSLPEWVTAAAALLILAVSVYMWMKGKGKKAAKLAVSAVSLLAAGIILFAGFCNPYWNSIFLRRNSDSISENYSRRDMRHHLNMLNGFLEADKPQQAKEYIKNVQADIESITPRQFCKNETVNLLCSSFEGKAERAGVRLYVDALLPEALPIEDTELCTMLSNGLENAITAAAEMEEPFKWVKLYCGIRLNKLLIEIKNPYAYTSAEEFTLNDGLPVSAREGHGYGCRSIRSIVRRHGGICEFKGDKGVFLLQIMLPMKEAPN